jgi:hypothetical protein
MPALSRSFCARYQLFLSRRGKLPLVEFLPKMRKVWPSLSAARQPLRRSPNQRFADLSACIGVPHGQVTECWPHLWTVRFPTRNRHKTSCLTRLAADILDTCGPCKTRYQSAQGFACLCTIKSAIRHKRHPSASSQPPGASCAARPKIEPSAFIRVNPRPSPAQPLPAEPVR